MSDAKIVEAFAKAATTYDNYADVQLLAASRLAAYLEANTRDLANGSILEVGCGTGLFSHRLIELFANRQFRITDLSPEMLDKCRARLSTISRGNEVTFAVQDAGSATQDFGTYAMIVAAFALQWVDQIEMCLAGLNEQLAENGKLFFSVPAEGSFAEWKATCKQAGVTFTGNPLPQPAMFRDFAKSNGLRLSLYEESFRISHKSLHSFLQSLKSLGANTATHSYHLSVSELRRLLIFAEKAHPHNFDVTYRVLFGHFSR
jgi:malonyl-ACP O-methyltransferase BioC